MPLQFQKQEIECLRTVLTQVQNLEQTQELRLPEGMSGVDRIPGCWGQVLIRSKEWNNGSVRVTGGVQIWMLYVPEDDAEPRSLESWIPFQTEFLLPEGVPEGQIRVMSRLRFADARPVTAGKVLIRAGIGLHMQCVCPEHLEVFRPEGSDETVDILTECWPVWLLKEAGEKSFELEEELKIPDSLPKPEKLVYCRMTVEISDKKVMTNKLVFRGSAWLHLVCSGSDGQLMNRDFELPFSQFAQLEGAFSSDAKADVIPAVTALELTLGPEGVLRLRAGLTGQYLIVDREILETAADIYSPVQDIKLEQSQLSVPALLEERKDRVSAELRIPVQADMIVDTLFLPDFPRQCREADALTLDTPGMVQLLYWDRNGQLQGCVHRWEGKHSLKADDQCCLMVHPGMGELQVQQMQEDVVVKAEVPLQLQFSSGTSITMVTHAEPGESRPLPENRPSLILQRWGGKSLWELARTNGSRVSLIRQANGLEGEPEEDRMLLIPIL